MEKDMNVLYCGDKNICDGILISVLSLLESTKEKLDVYILTAALEQDAKKYSPIPQAFADKLNDFVSGSACGGSVTLFDISDIFLAELPLANLDTKFTPFSMLRLYADEVEELPKKLLYLDNDVVCLYDCSNFYNRNMDGVEIAGVLDRYGKWFFRRRALEFDYLNSGVLLMNLDEIRNTGLFAECRRRCREKAMLLPDQSAINQLASKKLICQRKYNEQKRETEDTVFRHFTTTFRFFPRFTSVTVKPWDIERVHSVLKTDRYDGLYNSFKTLKNEIMENEYE
jgi:lipopolysaccharide biosynthesis glycosyltransferase